MIRDFFLTLVLLTLMEIGGRALFTYTEFQHEGGRQAESTAQHLAADVKSIMLNRGGPTASRTVYPILKRNHHEIGFEIAIEPSQVTVTSMQKRFNLTPKGLAPKWSEGRFHEATVELIAEQFCIQCHIDAKVGEVLGQVTVRSYLSGFFARWWQEAQLMSVVGMWDIILHTVVLYILLKARMAPLLYLRSVMNLLAKGERPLRRDARLRSDDEFGELTLDLNRFLHRVDALFHELDALLSRINNINRRLAGSLLKLDEQVAGMQNRIQQVTQRAFSSLQQLATQDTAPVPAGRIDDLVASLGDNGLSGTYAALAKDVLLGYESWSRERQETAVGYREFGEELATIARDSQRSTHLLGEMRVLEEKINGVAESGKELLKNIDGKTGPERNGESASAE